MLNRSAENALYRTEEAEEHSQGYQKTKAAIQSNGAGEAALDEHAGMDGVCRNPAVKTPDEFGSQILTDLTRWLCGHLLFCGLVHASLVQDDGGDFALGVFYERQLGVNDFQEEIGFAFREYFEEGLPG